MTIQVSCFIYFRLCLVTDHNLLNSALVGDSIFVYLYTHTHLFIYLLSILSICVHVIDLETASRKNFKRIRARTPQPSNTPQYAIASITYIKCIFIRKKENKQRESEHAETLLNAVIC